MKYDVRVYNFKNYLNRKLDYFTSLSDYGTPTHTDTGVTNWNWSNGVETEYLMTLTSAIDTPDYLILTENGKTGIVARWYVMEANYTRQNQYKLLLRRDLLADFHENYKDSPMFVEKAMLVPGDPAIFNKENIGFNQIKTSETLLKDTTGCSWIVGYYERGATVSGSNVGGDFVYDYSTGNTLENWEYYSYSNLGGNTKWKGSVVDYKGRYYTRVLDINYQETVYNKDRVITVWDVASQNSFVHGVAYNISFATSHYIQNVLSYINLVPKDHSSTDTNNFLSLDGKTIEFTNGQYRISINYLADEEDSQWITPVVGTALHQRLVSDTGNHEITGNPFSYKAKRKSYTLSLTPISQAGKTYKYSFSQTRRHCIDSIYDVFAIPYKGDYWFNPLDINDKCIPEVQLMIAQDIAKNLGGQNGKIYDLQILPFRPADWIDNYSWITDYKKYDLIKDSSDRNAGIIFHIESTSFTFDIPYSINMPNSSIEIKKMNECDVYRICSPNYQGVFEFNPAKNNGVSKFKVSCTYKPFSPYIKIAPDFGGLYGRDFGDNRGLILGGDFSLPVINDHWKNYELNNKNYQNIFNRQIENIEFNNREAMRLQNWQGVAGMISGISYGAMAGGLSGLGPAGAIAGAGLGAVAGYIGAKEQFKYLQRTQAENMDYKQDLFGYELGNIKARPDTISKTTPFCIDNKYFPFIEYYTCTDVEKKAFEDKLTWNGMSVMRIGTFEEFEPNGGYIKGQLIRTNINEDANLLIELQAELAKGVYV